MPSDPPFIAFASAEKVTISKGWVKNTYDVPVELIAIAPSLKEALNNVTSGLETCLIAFKDKMHPPDVRNWEHHVTVARALLALTK